MTHTTTSTQPKSAPASHRTNPIGMLMNLIAALLAPMFLGVTNGDIGLARMAAIETVSAYRTHSLTDILAIAQIVGFGLAALGSLSLSMDDDLSLPMILRLRGTAIAMSRCAEQNRRAIKAHSGDDTAPYQDASPAEPATPTAIAQYDDHAPAETFLSDAAAQMLAAESRARLSDSANAFKPAADRAPVARVAPIAAPDAAPTDAEKRHKQMWAIAMTKEASEINASIPGLPPAERSAASIRAGMLSSTASRLLNAGGVSKPAFRIAPDGRPA